MILSDQELIWLVNRGKQGVEAMILYSIPKTRKKYTNRPENLYVFSKTAQKYTKVPGWPARPISPLKKKEQKIKKKR